MSATFALRRELARLCRLHNVKSQRVRVPFAEPTEHALVLSGIASTADIDDDRTRFMPFCFGRQLSRLPLLLEHTGDPIGSVDLHYDSLGRLCARAVVTDRAARRRDAWSVSARIKSYSLHNAECADFHFEIESAELCEISLVAVPVNAACRVTERARLSAADENWSAIRERIARLSTLMTEVKSDLSRNQSPA